MGPDLTATCQLRFGLRAIRVWGASNVDEPYELHGPPRPKNDLSDPEQITFAAGELDNHDLIPVDGGVWFSVSAPDTDRHTKMEIPDERSLGFRVAEILKANEARWMIDHDAPASPSAVASWVTEHANDLVGCGTAHNVHSGTTDRTEIVAALLVWAANDLREMIPFDASNDWGEALALMASVGPVPVQITEWMLAGRDGQFTQT